MKTHLNLELAITSEMIEIACDLKPQDCCFVPEKREELTTEGGLDVIGQFDFIKDAYEQLANSKIRVSLFIDPDFNQIDAALETGVPVIELHTGAYADAPMEREELELKKIIDSAKYASEKGLIVHAGHGLNYENVVPVAKINEIIELNIGHSIISYASIVGLKRAIQEMIKLIINARG
jgi:pyridoxine 5-phosphate synthase